MKSGIFEMLALLSVLSLSTYLAYDGLFNTAGYFLPTYDNAMLHAGRAADVIATGLWPYYELVFGGITPSYHLPAYPALIAAFSTLTGLNLLWAERGVTLLLALFLPFAFFMLAKHVANDWRAGALAAFFALVSANMMPWVTRNAPVAFGAVLLLLALYFVAARRPKPAAFVAFALALTHPVALAVLVLTLVMYQVLLIARRRSAARAAMLSAAVAFATYLAWHMRLTGLSCLTLKCLPQGAAREFGKSINLLEYFQQIPQALGIAGVAAALLSKRISTEHKTLLFAWLAATLLLVKNDLLGIGVFTERFLTYLDQAVAVFAGIGIAVLYGMLYGKRRQRR